MKHIFIVNPAAGPRDSTAEVKARIEALSADIDYEIYCTTGRGDATDFVRKMCQNKFQNYRFYACGGDGTLNEVASGVVGAENASISVLPCGSGNDFIKYYGTAEDFSDLESLINGVDHPIDIIKVGDKYSINVVNIGFEPAVVRTMEKVKRIKFMTGKKAYYVGILTALINSMKTKAKVFVDGEQVGNDCVLLGSVANGKYVGGSFMCAPHSLNDDGLLEVCVVKTMSRFKFLDLIGLYQNGTHLDSPKAAGFIDYKKGKNIVISGEDELCYCVDGELNYAKQFCMEAVPNAVKFSVPLKLAEKLNILDLIEKEREASVC